MDSSILFIPRDRALVGPSAFGVTIPTATHESDPCTPGDRWGIYGGDCRCGARALPLVWRGEVVTESMDRLIRALSRSHVGKTAPYAVYGWGLNHAYTVVDVLDVARTSREAGLGEVVVVLGTDRSPRG